MADNEVFEISWEKLHWLNHNNTKESSFNQMLGKFNFEIDLGYIWDGRVLYLVDWNHKNQDDRNQMGDFPIIDLSIRVTFHWNYPFICLTDRNKWHQFEIFHLRRYFKEKLFKLLASRRYSFEMDHICYEFLFIFQLSLPSSVENAFILEL